MVGEVCLARAPPSSRPEEVTGRRMEEAVPTGGLGGGGPPGVKECA